MRNKKASLSEFEVKHKLFTEKRGGKDEKKTAPIYFRQRTHTRIPCKSLLKVLIHLFPFDDAWFFHIFSLNMCVCV